MIIQEKSATICSGYKIARIDATGDYLLARRPFTTQNGTPQPRRIFILNIKKISMDSNCFEFADHLEFIAKAIRDNSEEHRVLPENHQQT